MEWVNYIYYNQQRFINYTDNALSALGEQLQATSRMTRQNRWVLDWMLAEMGGVFVLFGKDCCTVIPNNTSPEGTFTQAMDRLKALRHEVMANTGYSHQVGDWLERIMGHWGSWLAKAGLIIGVTLIIVILLLSCFLPLLRSSLHRAIGIQLVFYRLNTPMQRARSAHQFQRRNTPHYQSPREPLQWVSSRIQYENLLLGRVYRPKDRDDTASEQAYESTCWIVKLTETVLMRCHILTISTSEDIVIERHYWGSWLAKAGLIIGVTLIIVILLLSCFLPLLRSSLHRAIGIQLVFYRLNTPMQRARSAHQFQRRNTPHYQSPREPLLWVPSRIQYENLLLERVYRPKDRDDTASEQAYESTC